MKNTKILIVDDEVINLRVCSEILKLRSNHGFKTVSSGKECLEELKNDNYDLILLDVMMPEMDGYDVAGIIKNDPKTSHIPIIFLSALSNPAEKIKGLAFADDYITKPFNHDELIARIDSKLRSFGVFTKVNESLNIVLSFIQDILLHEILTPLSGITGTNTLVNDSLQQMINICGNCSEGKSSCEILQTLDKLVNYIDKQKTSIERFKDITVDIRKAIAEEKYNLSINKEQIAIKDIVKSAIKRYNNYKLSIEVNYLNTENDFLLCDMKKIEDAFIIIIDNAFKFNYYSNQPKLQLSIKLEDGYYIFMFKDNGIGIESEHLHNIFEPFYLGHEFNNHKSGFGLGLSIAKNIVSKHGGFIWAESVIKEGSTFYIKLPMMNN